MIRLLILIALVTLTAACNRGRSSQIPFDGVIFRSSADAVTKEDQRVFTVSVSPVSASLEGSREAALYEGTRYCIENYGTSRIAWTVGPETETTDLRISDDTLLYSGKCRT